MILPTHPWDYSSSQWKHYRYSDEGNYFRLYYKIVSYDNYFLRACVVFLFAKYKNYAFKKLRRTIV